MSQAAYSQEPPTSDQLSDHIANIKDYPVITQTFLQCVMSSRGLTNAQGLLDQIITNMFVESRVIAKGQPISTLIEDSDRKLKKAMTEVVRKINLDLSRLELNIKAVRDQQTGNEMLVFVNLQASPSTAMATLMGAPEIDIIKKMVSSMFSRISGAADSYFVTPIHVVEATRTIGSISRNAALEKLLLFVETGWFIEIPMGSHVRYIESYLTSLPASAMHTNNNQAEANGSTQQANQHENDLEEDYSNEQIMVGTPGRNLQAFTLSARAIAELERYLISNFGADSAFNTLKTCKGCNAIFTIGLKCPSCAVRYHVHCYNRYIEMTNQTSCQGCGVPLSSFEHVNTPNRIN